MNKYLRPVFRGLPPLASSEPPMFTPEMAGIPFSHPWVIDALDRLNLSEGSAEDFQNVIASAPTENMKYLLYGWFAARYSLSHLVVRPAQ